MRDNENLKKKIKKYYPKLIKEAIRNNDQRTVEYLTWEITRCKELLEQRQKNKKKNEKLYNKKH